MRKFKVIALSVGGSNNKIYSSGETVNENNFPAGHADAKVKSKHLEEIKVEVTEDDIKAKAEAAAKVKAEADAKAKSEAEAKAKAEEDAQEETEEKTEEKPADTISDLLGASTESSPLDGKTHEDFTVKELKAFCDDKKIEYVAKATRKDLFKLLTSK